MDFNNERQEFNFLLTNEMCHFIHEKTYRPYHRIIIIIYVSTVIIITVVIN